MPENPHDMDHAPEPPSALLRWMGLFVALGLLAYGAGLFANKIRTDLSGRLVGSSVEGERPPCAGSPVRNTHKWVFFADRMALRNPNKSARVGSQRR
jgi:hypothetical protein